MLHSRGAAHAGGWPAHGHAWRGPHARGTGHAHGRRQPAHPRGRVVRLRLPCGARDGTGQLSPYLVTHPHAWYVTSAH